jgi:Leucine-rich repeat (LRR) protein
MADQSVKLLLSCVSDEFGVYRDALRHALTRPNVEVKAQEDFKALGGDTLRMLEEYVAQCEAVVHFVGEMTGSEPAAPSVDDLLARRPDLEAMLAKKGMAREALAVLSYTQWEAWLAICFGKNLVIVQPAPGVDRSPKFAPTDASRELQGEHLKHLKAIDRYPGQAFTSADSLVAQIFGSAVIDALVKAQAIMPRQPPPKLPSLDKADLSAIRSFLPGKVLGRTSALLAALLAVLLYTTPLDRALEGFLGFPLEPPWLWHSLLLGTVVLIVLAQILAEWRSERRRREARALAVKIEAAQEGYFRIGPYLDTADDAAKFDRADRAHEKVLDWIRQSAAMPLYLTGDSGSGKSSLLNSFVLPALRGAGWTVVEARAWQDPETALRAALVRLGGARKWKLGEFSELRGLFEAASKRTAGGLLIVLDQFEEFVILAEPERQKAFAALLADLHAKPIKGLKLLLVLRSDYQTAIDELGLPPLRQGENWVQVGRFTIAAAVRFMARSGLALQPDSLDRVVTSASEMDDSPGMIRPITLNVIGYVLSQGRATAPSLDADRLVRHYIEQSVEQPAIREIAPRVLKELVTEQGTKRPRSEQDLVDQSRLRLGEVRAVLNGLWAAALARPLDSAQGVWELSHDFVARAVARYLGRRRLDLPGLVSAFAAPALFGMMLASAAGAVAWNVSATARTSAELAELGVEVSSTPSGLRADPGTRFHVDNWTRVVALLGKLTALQYLNLVGTQVADLGRLKDLTALQSLDLVGMHVADLGPLKGLIALQSLNLFGTQVADLGPLKGLIALQSLNLEGTQVTDLGPLKDLIALQSLDLRSTQVADLGPLKGLTALQALNLGGTQVADLGPLKGLTALKSLDLRGTQVADLGPLKGLIALQSLDLRSTQVADLGPLKGLTALQALNLLGTHVADFGPLKDLIALQSLTLEGTQVTDLGPLKGLTALQSLNLNGLKVESLEPVQDLPSLSRLTGTTETEKQRFNAYRKQKELPAVSVR